MLDDSRAPFYRWFPGGELNTCYNALDRHVDGGRGEQAALIYDSPVTGQVAHLHLRASCATRSRASRARCAALGVERGDRVIIYMPMVPEAVDRDARLRAARRHPLGRLRRLRARTSSRPASTTRKPKVIVSASCGIEASADRRVQAAARRGDRARRVEAASAASSCSAPQARAALDPGPRPRLGRARSRAAAPARLRAGRRPPIRSTSSTPRAPPAQPKGVVRDNGGHAVALHWSMKNVYGVDARRGVLGRLRRRLGRRPLLHRLRARCSTAAPRCSTRASRSARPTPARSGA